MYRDFWASEVPVILCEGKTDSVYLRGAIRRLATKHPNLVSMNAAGKADYKSSFLQFLLYFANGSWIYLAALLR